MKINQKNHNAGDVNNQGTCKHGYTHVADCTACALVAAGLGLAPAPAVSTETGRAYRPRTGYVVCRSVAVPTSHGGVALPDRASESKMNVVAAVGPAVSDIKVGDRVLVGSAVEGGTYARLPGERELFITHQDNVLLSWEEEAP